MAELHPLATIENNELNLPGFMSPTEIGTAFKDDTDWQTVLSLTIISGIRGSDTPKDYEVFTAIRDKETNPTHPDIVSTPTGRIPKSFAQMILSSALNSETDDPWTLGGAIDPTHPLEIKTFDANIEQLPNNESMLAFVVADLMAKKLGCASAIEKSSNDNPLGTASLSNVIAGFSLAQGEDGFEPLLMIGSTVFLEDPSIIPKETESYRKASWVSIEDFVAGLETKDSLLMIPGITDIDQIDVCVRGLCLATSAKNILNFNRLREHLPQE